MFNTYVINTNQSIHRWEILKDRLEQQSITPIRFEAITPDTYNNYRHKVSTFASMFCPIIAKCIGISHLVLLENIYYNDPYEYALVLEDDVVPAADNIKHKIQTILNTTDMWDMIKLYWFFYNKKEDVHSQSLQKINFLQLSAAAYLIKKSSILKIIDEKVNYHIDLQFNFMNLNILHSPMKIFETYEEDCSSNREKSSYLQSLQLKCLDTPGNKGIMFWGSFKALRIPLLNIELKVLDIFIFIILLCICLKL